LARNHTGGVTLSNTEEHIEREYHHFKERYERLKTNLSVKLQLLDDNRVWIVLVEMIRLNYERFLDKSYATTVDLIS
jgi:hypothetical protein